MPGARASSQPPAPLPLLLVTSCDPTLPQNLAARLDPRASVKSVRTIFELVRSLEEAGVRRTVIVIDCKNSSIRPPAIAALAEELSSTTQVVLWGASREDEAAILAVSSAVSEWLGCGSTRIEDIARRLDELTG